MTSPKDPTDGGPAGGDPEKANGKEAPKDAPKDAKEDGGEDALNLAYLSPHEKAQGGKHGAAPTTPTRTSAFKAPSPT